MAIQKLADGAAADITRELGAGEDKTVAVSRIVEKAIIAALLDAHSRHAHVIKGCCEDEDLAHKIAHEIRQKDVALVANLSSMR